MSERSWYDVLRRRVAPIAMILALVALSYQTCQAESAEVDLALRFGSGAEAVESVRVDVLIADSGEHVAYFERRFPGGAPFELQQTIPLPARMYRLDIELEVGGERRRLSRIIDVEGSGGIRVDLGAELDRAP